MSENKKIISREELTKEVLEKAGADKDFKKALMDNPKETLGRLGVQVPEGVEIRVVEESPQVLYLVLPVNLDELTDEQLDNVAAGSCVIDSFICIGKCDSFDPCRDYSF